MPPPPARPSAFRTALAYVPRHRGALVVGAVALVLAQLIGAGAPQILKAALSILEAGAKAADGAVAGSHEPANRAVLLAALYAGAMLVQGLLTFVMRTKIIGFSRDLERDLKRDVFAHVARLPVSFFDRMRTGDLLSRLTSDVEAVRFSVGPGVMYLAQTAVKLPAALAAMLWMDWRLTLVCLFPLAGIFVVVRLISPAILRQSRALQDRTADLSARAQENFAGARVVRAYAVEDREQEAFRKANEAVLFEAVGLARRRGWMTGGLRMMGDLGLVAVVWLGGTYVMRGEVDRSTLLAFIFYLDMLWWPMISFGYVLASFQRAAGAMQRIDEVLATPTEPDAPGGLEPGLPDRVSGSLSIRDLQFTYEGASRPALSDVSVDVPAGSTLALVGPVGSGKSTLAALLARLYEPPAGTVFLDDVDVRRFPLSRLRASFAFVPQDAFLFSDTIASNLGYGLSRAPEPARVALAAKSAGLEDDLARFEGGLDTVVGERGITLSGGQKQRATIARALLSEAPVLVLDDALSAVDTRTEARILDGLRGERRGRTTVVVAHRLSTVRDADRIVVLDGGRVAENGTHDELVASGGWYARTWRLQRLHAEIEELT